MFDFIRKPVLWDAWDQGLADEIGGTTYGFELKSMQDLAVYLYLREARGKRIAEIGAGYSRLLSTLARANTCVAVEKFEGKGGGPSKEKTLPNIRNVSAYLGENHPELPSSFFDIVFSISVVEHVATDELSAFHEDQLRILKPGGMFLHAIDFYLEDEPAGNHVRRFEAYRDWVTSTAGVSPVGSVYQGPCSFTCDLATNPDNVMYQWGKSSPSLSGLRQAAQSVSLLVAGRKVNSAAPPKQEQLPKGEQEVTQGAEGEERPGSLGVRPPSSRGNGSARLAYFPVIEDEDQLIDILSRAAWFLTFSPIEKIFVFVADPKLAYTEWKVAPGMDPVIAQRFDALRGLIEFVPASSGADIAPAIEQVSMVLRWKEDVRPEWVSEAELTQWLANKQVFEVDADAVRMEGGNYLDVGLKLMTSTADVIADNRTRFAAVARRLGRYDQAFVLATGPSIGDYGRFDYEDALAIVCNTVILNQELMETVRPQFVVFADPIFHFGPSRFAAKFRASLRRAAEQFDFTICMPFKYYGVFAAAAPELLDRTVAFPFRKERDFNFDLVSDFELKTTANVLTFVMLPLAATFADRVGVLGCDGRPLSEDRYFWRHNRATQINEEMRNIRDVHPGFFKIDYNDYYLEHCEVLEEQLQVGEQAGYCFESLADSHIPALKRRVAEAQHLDPATADDEPERNVGRLPQPRLLVIDSTRVGGLNATGQLKKNLLAGWPEDAFLQIYVPQRDRYALARSLDDPSTDAVLSAAEGLSAVADFDPEVIYYRPTIDLHPGLHALASEILSRHPVPLVTHLMDDWPSRLAANDGARAQEVDRDLREVLAKSHKVLSISEKMSTAFGERYGVAFEAIANGIDPDACRRVSTSARAQRSRRKEVLLRYCGALAEDMTFHALVDVARAVDALRDELPVRLEVYTMPTWRPAFEEAVSGLRGVKVLESVADEAYPSLLAEADIVVLAYNFDQNSLRYICLSMPNKLPEYLGSGAAILAVGPREAGGIDYVLSRQLGRCVTERDPEKLAEAIRQLATDSDYRDSLAAKAQDWAFEHLDIGRISGRFQTILRGAAEQRDRTLLLGPFSRAQKASIDESGVMARLFAARGPDRVLVDVGAHRGSSVAPFADAGWTVIACEPDASNREELAKRFGKRGNISIDSRAVSDEPAKGAAFFSSEESTGISGLHAFRETHQQTDRVDVTTIAELVGEYGLSRIDFLKIDVEGFDFNVLKGVPWNRIKPDAIACEFEDAKTVSLGHTYRHIADYLVKGGYAVYLSEWHPVIRYGTRHDWRQLVRYPGPLGSPDAWGNILAFREDPGADVVTAAFESCLEVESPPATEPDNHEPASVAAVSASARDGGTAGHDALPPPSRPSWAARAVRLARRTRNKKNPVMPTRSSLYERFYFRAKARSPLVFRAGRLAMWCARKVRRYPGWTVACLALLASLIAGGFWTTVEPYGPLFWAAAGLLVLAGTVVVATGYAGFLIKHAEHESQRRQNRMHFEQDRTKDALEARIGELQSEQKRTKDALETEIGQQAGEQKRTKDALEAKIDQLESKLTVLDGLSSAVDAVRREVAQPNLRYPVADSGTWVSFGALEHGSSNHQARRLKVGFAGGEGVQPLTQAMLLPIEAGGRSQNVGVSSLQELRQQGVHAALWGLEPPVEVDAIGVLIALKPQGRRYVELSLDESERLVSARFDLEEVAFLGGSGPEEAAAAVHEADGGWRLCCIRLPLASQADAVLLRLALASSDDFALDYEGDPKRGVLAADPVAIKE